MIKLGEYNRLKVARQKDYGYFLEELATIKTESFNNESKFSDEMNRYVEKEKSVDVLLPNKNIPDGEEIDLGDIINVFVYKDSHKRLVATLKKPLATAGEVSVLEVVDKTDIGYFVNIGIERDVLVPFRERKYELMLNEKYPFYIYIDKSGRLAATTDIDEHLSVMQNPVEGDIVKGIVYGFQTNGTAKICVFPDFKGVILKDEYYTFMKEGDVLDNLRIIKVYEDGRIGLTPRSQRKDEMSDLERKILSYMEGNDGFMRFNDKSDAEEIRTVFNASKKNFKRTLGVLMKKKAVRQDEKGTYLI